jgi:hypothetical protein
MLVTLTSARAGTGVTTAAVGLAAAWPAPVLLIEADPSGYSSILAGAFAAAVPVGAGVLDAAMSARAGRLAADLPGMLAELPGTNARVLPGLSSVAQRKSLTAPVWLDLGAALRSWADESGIDVLIDCGALPDAAHPSGLHPLADAVVLVTRPDLVGVSSSRNWVDELADALPDPARLHVMVTGSHPAYPASMVAGYLHLPLLADLGEDLTTAAHYSHGTPLPRRHRGLLTRSLPAAASALRALAPEVVHV